MRALLLLTDPGFLQTMTLICLFLLVPLEKRSHPRLRATLFFVLALGFGVLMQCRMDLAAARWLVIPQNMFILLFCYLLFRCCTRLTRMDCVFAVTCGYILQHLHFCASSLLWSPFGLFALSPALLRLAEWPTLVLVGAVLGRMLSTHLVRNGRYRVSRPRVLLMAGIVFLVAFVFTASLFVLGYTDNAQSVYFLSYDLCSCGMMLWILLNTQKELNLLADLRVEQQLRRQMRDQLQLSRECAALINRKSHDLKHQLAALRLVQDQAVREEGIRQLEQSTLLYDTAVSTGNELLDTVLREGAIRCEANGIAWTCLADGQALAFVAPVDLYTLVGNALDNAIEASLQLAPERRAVQVTLRREYGSAFLQIVNFCSGAGPLPSTGFPPTSKPDKDQHGFGLASMQEIVTRYGGALDIEQTGELFLLNILIPLPDRPEPEAVQAASSPIH